MVANLPSFYLYCMGTGDFLFYNGKLMRDNGPLIDASNRSFRYGDGCFETMKMVNGKLCLASYHFERLFSALDLLRFECPAHFTPAYLEQRILMVAEKNKHTACGRVRLTIARGNGGLYDAANHFPNHLMQTWALEKPATGLNVNGVEMDIFPDARKVCDRYSMIKSNNYLPNVMAALWAKERRLNDAVLLNPYDRIADATIANIFIVKDGVIATPSLAEGAVNGVMRRHLLHCLHQADMPVEEKQITVQELLEASEVFLTNAIAGIKWVKHVGASEYGCQLAPALYDRFIANIHE
jgi:branched-chain amino acid aminotransferase